MAERYDGHPHIAFIDIGLSEVGRGHVWRHVDLHAKYFTNQIVSKTHGLSSWRAKQLAERGSPCAVMVSVDRRATKLPCRRTGANFRILVQCPYLETGLVEEGQLIPEAVEIGSQPTWDIQRVSKRTLGQVPCGFDGVTNRIGYHFVLLSFSTQLRSVHKASSH